MMGTSATTLGSPPAVSFVMTTFNSAPHVGMSISSVISQTVADWELLVVDDGSTDGTVAIVESFHDPRVRLVQVERSTRIACLNTGFRMARAPLVANLDSDDVCLPDRIAVTLQAMDEHRTWAMVGSATVPLIDAEGSEVGRRVRPTHPEALRRALGFSMPFFHSSCTYRKSAWEACGGFDETLPMLEDYDLWVKLAARDEVGNVLPPLALKRRHARQGFDEAHWTNRGYRTRALILRRYFRLVRRDPRVLLRATVYRVMGPRLRVLWMKATRRDPTELEVRRRLQGKGAS